MTELREFPTRVIASISTGILLCDFSKMHEAAEFLMGHPIWTHHFANDQMWQDMRRTIAEQCPGMPMKADGVEVVNHDNWQEFVAKLEADLGPVVTIRRGAGVTAMHPMDGIPDHLKDKTIII
jgi:hypothetical protein